MRKGNIFRRRRSRQRAYHEGSLRWRAAALLTDALGYPVYAENIRCAEGYYKREDVYRWEANTRQFFPGSKGDGVPHVYGCWLTLTVFVRFGEKYGVIVDKSDGEIWAKDAKDKKHEE